MNNRELLINKATYGKAVGTSLGGDIYEGYLVNPNDEKAFQSAEEVIAYKQYVEELAAKELSSLNV